MNEIFDENGNYIYPTDIFLDKPNTAIGYIPLSEETDECRIECSVHKETNRPYDSAWGMYYDEFDNAKPDEIKTWVRNHKDMDVIGYKLADEVNTIIENQEEMDRIRTAHLFGTVGGCYTSNSTDNKEK